MTISIRTVQFRAGDLPTRFRASVQNYLLREFAEAAEDSFILAAELQRGNESSLLDWSQSTESFNVGQPVRYDEWHNRQSAVGWWQAAFTWSVYWEAIQGGEHYLDYWPKLVEHPLICPPHLQFLELSFGYLMWDFQLEQLYRLGDPNYDASKQFRKDWIGGRIDAEQRAANLRLPGENTLLETIKNHAPPGNWKHVSGVRVWAVAPLVKTGG